MKTKLIYFFVIIFAIFTTSCSKSEDPAPTPLPAPAAGNPLKLYNKADGKEIKSGDILNFRSITNPANELKITAKNTSSASMTLVGKCTSTNGTFGKFCMISCYEPMAAGIEYPRSIHPAFTIAANSTAADDIVFENKAASGTTTIDYVWEIYQVDTDRNLIGQKISFTYRYIP